ncbi:MAG: hypothetical protein ACPHCJ_07725 [Oceanococcaceae bacterium]
MLRRDPTTRMLKDKLSKLSQRRFQEGMSQADFDAGLRATLQELSSEAVPAGEATPLPPGRAERPAKSGKAGLWIGVLLLLAAAAGLAYWYWLTQMGGSLG